jgi:hypothetical protein
MFVKPFVYHVRIVFNGIFPKSFLFYEILNSSNLLWFSFSVVVGIEPRAS